MNIQVLAPEVVNQIAAGEVVERPAHLVKELVENSLDAGAKNIEVDVDQGGRFVRVQDDGHGMSAKQLPLALARHATSKIRLSSDLWSLNSFGFRGEALASIAAVSRLTLTSKTTEQEQAYQLKSEFGKILPAAAVGGGQGTTLLIEELFGNVPARLKFLKAESAEVGQIKAVLKALAMANPGVTFRIKHKGELINYWAARENLLERVCDVLDQDTMFEGSYALEGVKARAIFCPPQKVARNSKSVWLFVQNRWVQDRGMQAAALDAYRNLLMHGEYPIAAIFLDCDPEDVDVNIHPTKSQVKFLRSSDAYRCVLHALRDTLEKAPWVAKITGSDLPKVAPAVVHGPAAPEYTASFAGEEFSRMQQERKQTLTRIADQLRTYSVKPQKEISASASEVSPSPALASESSSRQWANLEVLGQAHLTYLVTQSKEALVFVDQHAAHERVLFEKLMAAWKGGQQEVQNFLLPLSFELEADQAQALMEAESSLKRLGLSVESLGPTTIGVTAAPAILKDQALEAAIRKMAFELSEHGGSHALDKCIGDVCASLACHSAIRAGQAMSAEEMQSLLEQMDEFPMSSFCPHGRPVFVEYPLARLERDFGRIV